MQSFALLSFIIVTIFCGGLVRLLITYQDYVQINEATGFHPLMQPLIMFISSSMCLPVYIFKSKNPKFLTRRKKFKWAYLFIPSTLMLINVFQNVIGLRYLYHGLYIIMKSISIVSSVAIEKCFYSHRKYTKNQKVGLILTVVGQIGIGILSFFESDEIMQLSDDISTNVALGIILLLISVFPMAFYYLLQERFMKAFRLDPLQYVGTQSVINFFVTIILILTFQWTPCHQRACQFQHNNDFFLERVDIWWEQTTINNTYLYTVIIMILFFAVKVYLEFFIMKTYSGLACNIISSLYIIVPYFYGFLFGKWFEYSIIQLGGFLIIFIGVLIFYHIPNFSQFQDSDSQTNSSGNIKQYNQQQRILYRSSIEDQLIPTGTLQYQGYNDIYNQKQDSNEQTKEDNSQNKNYEKQNILNVNKEYNYKQRFEKNKIDKSNKQQIINNNNFNNENSIINRNNQNQILSSQNQYQQKQNQKYKNSDSCNDEDDSSIYFNNKIQQKILDKNSNDNSEKIKDGQLNQFLTKQQQDQFNQEKDQTQIEQNDSRSIQSIKKKDRNNSFGLWINQSNKRNKSNLYDQSILLLESQNSFNGQSILCLKDTTPKNNDQSEDNSIVYNENIIYEDEHQDY